MGKLKATQKALNSALDMSHAARMQRAQEQGFDTDVYHGTAGDFSSFTQTGSNTKARSAKEAVWLTDDPNVANGYARMAAEDAPVQKLIDDSRAAELDGNWDRAHELTVQAEELEGSGSLIDAGGQNVIPAKIRSANLMEIDAEGATMSDLDESQLYQWSQEAKAQGYEGLKINNFSDNADWGEYRPATHYAIFDPANIRSTSAAFDPANAGKNDLLGNATPEALAATAMAGAAATFLQRREEKKGKYDALRARLLDAVGKANWAAGQAMEALSMPMQGYHGLSAVAGDLTAGASLQDALMRGGTVARQPIEQTAYDLGGAVTDATGSPLAGTAVNVGVNLAEPF